MWNEVYSLICRLDPSYRHSAESSKPVPVAVHEISLLLIGMRDIHLNYLNCFVRMHNLSVVSLLLLLKMVHAVWVANLIQ